MHQNEIKELPLLEDVNYENLFSVHKENGYYFYNLLSKINFPEDLSGDTYILYSTLPSDTWYYISYKAYGTTQLWWLVCAVNQIDNPLPLPKPGTRIKLLNGVTVSSILEQLNSKRE